MPQVGESKTINGVTGQWDGQTWRRAAAPVDTSSVSAVDPGESSSPWLARIKGFLQGGAEGLPTAAKIVQTAAPFVTGGASIPIQAAVGGGTQMASDLADSLAGDPNAPKNLMEYLTRAAEGAAIPSAMSGIYRGAKALKPLISEGGAGGVTGGAVGAYEGYKRNGVLGALEGGTLGAMGGSALGNKLGKVFQRSSPAEENTAESVVERYMPNKSRMSSEVPGSSYHEPAAPMSSAVTSEGLKDQPLFQHMDQVPTEPSVGPRASRGPLEVPNTPSRGAQPPINDSAAAVRQSTPPAPFHERPVFEQADDLGTLPRGENVRYADPPLNDSPRDVRASSPFPAQSPPETPFHQKPVYQQMADDVPAVQGLGDPLDAFAAGPRIESGMGSRTPEQAALYERGVAGSDAAPQENLNAAINPSAVRPRTADLAQSPALQGLSPSPRGTEMPLWSNEGETELPNDMQRELLDLDQNYRRHTYDQRAPYLTGK